MASDVCVARAALTMDIGSERKMAESASHETLDYAVTDRVAYATLCLPEQRNTLTEQTLDDLNDVVARVQQDTGVRTLVLRGQGDVFSVGIDPAVLANLHADLEYYEHVLTRVAATGLSLEALDVPVIASVNGAAAEVGFDLALACDMIVIADEATIGDGRATHGRVPGGGSTVRLPRAVGLMTAREILFSGRMLTGPQAAQIGLALRSVPRAQLDAAVAELAATFADKSRPALATIKRQINGSLGLDTPSAIEHERSEIIKHVSDPHSGELEGLRAEQEGRPASWA
jgi:enoyl-CoA hydratase/carnithine racemase